MSAAARTRGDRPAAPAHTRAVQPRETRPAAQPGTARPAGRRPVGVVDVLRAELLRDSLAAYLEDCGFSVLPVGSGEEALASLSEVCVAIVDIRLRGMDGLTFIKKAHALRPDILYIIHAVDRKSVV